MWQIHNNQPSLEMEMQFEQAKRPKKKNKNERERADYHRPQCAWMYVWIVFISILHENKRKFHEELEKKLSTEICQWISTQMEIEMKWIFR